MRYTRTKKCPGPRNVCQNWIPEEFALCSDCHVARIDVYETSSIRALPESVVDACYDLADALMYDHDPEIESALQRIRTAVCRDLCPPTD